MAKLTMADFLYLSFQASLGTEALLFVVFGFLYTVFGTYNGKDRPPIVAVLRRVCRGIAAIIFLNAALTIYSLVLMYFSGVPFNVQTVILGIGFVLIILAIAIFSVVWAVWYMED